MKKLLVLTLLLLFTIVAVSACGRNSITTLQTTEETSMITVPEGAFTVILSGEELIVSMHCPDWKGLDASVILVKKGNENNWKENTESLYAIDQTTIDGSGAASVTLNVEGIADLKDTVVVITSEKGTVQREGFVV